MKRKCVKLLLENILLWWNRSGLPHGDVPRWTAVLQTQLVPHRPRAGPDDPQGQGFQEINQTQDFDFSIQVTHKVDTYYLKWRYYFQEYQPASEARSASHKHLHHWVFLIDAQVDQTKQHAKPSQMHISKCKNVDLIRMSNPQHSLGHGFDLHAMQLISTIIIMLRWMTMRKTTPNMGLRALAGLPLTSRPRIWGAIIIHVMWYGVGSSIQLFENPCSILWQPG